MVNLKNLKPNASYQNKNNYFIRPTLKFSRIFY